MYSSVISEDIREFDRIPRLIKPCFLGEGVWKRTSVSWGIPTPTSKDYINEDLSAVPTRAIECLDFLLVYEDPLNYSDDFMGGEYATD